MVSDTTVGRVTDAELDEVDGEDMPRHTYEKGTDILAALLSRNDLGQQVEGSWFCKRLGIAFPIRSLTPDEFERLNKEHTVRKRIGKTTQIHSEIDNDAYNFDVVRMGCLEPNFNSPEVRRALASKSGRPNANTANDSIRTVFLIGEVFRLAGAILELSGFEDEEENTNALKD